MAGLSEEALRERAAILRRAFVHQIPERLRQLDDALAGGVEGADPSAEIAESSPESEDEPLAVAVRIVHSLRGSALTFGLLELARAASALEAELQLFPNFMRDSSRTPSRMAAFRDARAAVQAVADRLRAEHRPTAALPGRSNPRHSVVPRSEEIWLVAMEDAAVGQSMRVPSDGFRVFSAVGTALTALSASRPKAIVGDPDAAGASILVGAARQNGVPYIAVSQRRDFASRLAAVRAGVATYLVGPIDRARIAEQVERAIDGGIEAPIRVLLVDEDRGSSTLHAAVLQAEGMLVRVLRQPARVLEELEALTPDIVLVDAQLRDGSSSTSCSGIELVSVLRQDSAWLGLPILLISSEKDLDHYVAAMGKGADDFIAKPVTPDRLVSQVRARVARARALRALNHIDMLTGVDSTLAFESRLSSEIARSLRDQESLAVVVLEIDALEPLREAYGPAAGDRVLQSLTVLLRKRLRRSDGIARAGRDGFALCLPGASGEAAVRVLDEIRRTFSEVVHGAGPRSFCATFSAGVAVLELDSTLDTLIGTAEEGLRIAMRGERADGDPEANGNTVHLVHSKGSVSGPARSSG